jgi:hypothetical protein
VPIPVKIGWPPLTARVIEIVVFVGLGVYFTVRAVVGLY